VYAELHCLTNFSFLRGASHAQELVDTAARLGYAALAITDECSLAGVVRAHVAARAHPGLKLLIGAEFRLDDGLRFVLLAMNRAGYGHLSGLVTRGRRRAPKGEYRLSRADLEAGLPDCLALWLPCDAPQIDAARWLAQRFPGRLWIAVELLARSGDRARLEALQEIGRATGLPCVAAGDVHMHARGRRALQDTLTAIRLGVTVADAGLALQASGERHLRPLERLRRIYPAPLLEESVRIAGLCRFCLDELRYEYPAEIVPAGLSPTQHLAALTRDGLAWRYPDGVPPSVRKGADAELALIAELRYEAFFLTVHDVVRYARSRDILCQGRGSAANSVVCYALGITSVDPTRTRLLFGRFLSKERNEPPDIDVDFEHRRREEVIQYLYRKYGRHRTALAATVISYRTRNAFRDVGKALGLDAAQVDRIAGSCVWWDDPRERATRLEEAGFDPASPVIRKLVALTGVLSGFPRHLSQHVGGFVISGGPLSQLVPVENAAMPGDPGRYTDAGVLPEAAAADPGNPDPAGLLDALRTNIQWDKDDLEALGLLKVDVLALGMLTAIRMALDLVNRRHGSAHTLASILGTESTPEGAPVYDMLCRADSIGVFQVESRAQMSMLPRLKPRNYYDLVIEVAIVRPGPIQGGMVHPYLAHRGMDRDRIPYPSEDLRKVLERTLGVPIFQEQVMEIAMVAAGFTVGEADQLRRAMAAWKRKGGLGPFRERLVGGMTARGYSPAFAGKIFRQIEGFGEYGFPESHSASFALLVYASAWLKHYEPAAFTCALLNSQPMGFYAPAQLVQDAKRHGVEVRPVDVLASGWSCSLEEKGAGDGGRGTGEPPALRLGLRMVKGFSEEGARRLIEARQALMRNEEDPAPSSLVTRHSSPGMPPLPSFEALSLRAGLSRKERNALAAAGALESLAGHRHHAAWQAAGIGAAPALLAGAPVLESAPLLSAPTEAQDILADYATTGLTLRRHPLALLRPRLRARDFVTAEQLQGLPDKSPVRVAGLVTCRQHPGTARGVIFVTLEDETGQINVVVWKRLSQRQRRPLLASRLMRVDGLLERSSGVVHLIAEHLEDYSAMVGSLEARSRDFH
jgi:error-prone DNA polymerase